MDPSERVAWGLRRFGDCNNAKIRTAADSARGLHCRHDRHRRRVRDQLRGPIIILQAIASGVLGKASFAEGSGAAALGLVLQWAMSLLIAAIFVVASRRMPALRRRWVGAGLAYGVVILVVMNYVVVPLSAIHRFPHFAVVHFLGDLLAMLVFGLIVAFFAREPSRSQATRNEDH
jgi:uncharacterized membrane protein YagU involved in acid resistance